MRVTTMYPRILLVMSKVLNIFKKVCLIPRDFLSKKTLPVVSYALGKNRDEFCYTKNKNNCPLTSTRNFPLEPKV